MNVEVLSKDKDLKNIIKFIASLFIAFIAYIPTFKWMVDRWMAHESYYSHGFLIPLASLYFVWQKRESLKKAAISNNMGGLVLVAASLLVHIACAALKVYFLSGFSFVFTLLGLILFFFGKDVAKSLAFPVLLLLAMIPLPLLLISNLIVKLKLGVAQATTFMLNMIGFPSVRDGSTIRMPNSFIVVAAPCSGLRSLVSLITLGVLFAYTVKVSYIRKSVLLISSIPIALGTNVIRVSMLAVANDLYGQRVLDSFFHDLSGYIMFGIAFFSLYMVRKVF